MDALLQQKAGQRGLHQAVLIPLRMGLDELAHGLGKVAGQGVWKLTICSLLVHSACKAIGWVALATAAESMEVLCAGCTSSPRDGRFVKAGPLTRSHESHSRD